MLVAASAWKGSLSAAQTARALSVGARGAGERVEAVCLRVADGGADTAEIVAGRLGAARRHARVHGPRGELHRAAWFRAPGAVAVMDLASACGLHLLRGSAPRPLDASTRGLGELVRAALDEGCRTIWIGLGGSASTDAGTGAASALGVRFLDARGRVLPDGGAALRGLARVDLERADARLARARILLLCDVRAPLLGPGGAAALFAPQKGASLAQVAVLERGLARFLRFAGGSGASAHASFAAAAGGGAAGGAAAGLALLLGGTILPGAAAVLDLLRFDAVLSGVDAVVCGEGRYEGALHAGKINDEIVRRAARAGVPTAIVCGSASAAAAAGPRGEIVAQGDGRRLGSAQIARLAMRALRAPVLEARRRRALP